MTTNIFYQQALQFLQTLNVELLSNDLELKKHWNIDHLCYRTASPTEYEDCKKSFLLFSELLIESLVNGRPICTFRLKKPISFLDWQIDLVELPAPKMDSTYKSGFEHIEVVIDEPFEKLQTSLGPERFDTAALKKDFNQELRLPLNCGSVKFHHLSLQSVVQLEKNIPVFTALRRLKILSDFQDCHPLIAGTFPLEISTAKSDLDILMTASDFNFIKQKISTFYSSLPHFQINETKVSEEPTLIANFIFMNIPFELFIQNTPSVRQRGYLHFLIEERLLKLGGKPFTNRIQQLRLKGLKTEPAFAKALDLQGDPYLELLKLQTESDQSLIERLNQS